MKNIQKTDNYGLFSTFNWNREVRQSKVNNIKKSIETVGFEESKSITVSPTFQIIDGQHRFNALMQLNLPIYFIVSEKEPKELAILLNANQVNWNLSDYIKSNASQGLECYMKLESFMVDYKIDQTVAIAIFTKYSLKGSEIRAGKLFKINEKSHDIMSFLNKSKNFIDFYKTREFVLSIVKLHDKASRSNIDKILIHIPAVQRQVSSLNYMAIFQNYLNRGIRKNENKVNLTI